MKVFRELTIAGPPAAIERALTRLMDWSLPSGWLRNPSEEKRVGGTELYCFECHEPDYPQASLWIARRSLDGSLWVSNVVPSGELSQLSVDQYNAIVKAFFDHVALPVLEGSGAKLTLTNDVVSIDEWLSPAASYQLIAFSTLANRGTGSSHPFDRERWFQFIFTAHRENSTLAGAELRVWLREQKWPEDRATDLMYEYESARELLRAYDASSGLRG